MEDILTEEPNIYEYFYPKWKNISEKYLTLSKISYIVSIVLFVFIIIFILLYFYNFNFYFILFLISIFIFLITFLIVRITTIKRYKFTKNKITRIYWLKDLRKVPGYDIDFAQAVYNFGKSLIKNNIQYKIIPKKILSRLYLVEFQLKDKSYSIFVQPNFANEGIYVGLIISLGPNVTKKDQNIRDIISLIERIFDPDYTL